MPRPGSRSSTMSPVLVSGAPSGMKSPSWMCCSSGMIRLALGQFSGIAACRPSARCTSRPGANPSAPAMAIQSRVARRS